MAETDSRQTYFEELTPGMELAPIPFGPINPRRLVKWTAAAWDFHDIHYDLDYARAQGHADLVVHGPLKLALLGRLLMRLAGPQGWVKRLRGRYLGMDLRGATLIATGKVTALDPETGTAELELIVLNEKGERSVVGDGAVTLPRRR